MTPTVETIAQAGKLVRLRALRRDVGARALARARALLAEAEVTVARALAARDTAMTDHAAARAALCACKGAVALHLDHVAGRLATVVQARATLVEAETARDVAAEAARVAARTLARLTARHDQLATRHRALGQHRARTTEMLAADDVEPRARAA